MIFGCLPPTGKCEWAILRGFVDAFNAAYGTTYARAKCLDVEGRSEKEPEILLEAPRETSVVIERKSVVWPPTFFKEHSKEHHFRTVIFSRLSSAFLDSVYELTINSDPLMGTTKSKVAILANQVADVVLTNQANAKTQRGLHSQQPIPWSFRPVPPSWRDETVPERGLGITVLGPHMWPENPSEVIRMCKKARHGYETEFVNQINSAAVKFKKYSNCLRLLLVQFYGDGLFTQDEDIIHIIKTAQLPDGIDQVWAARREWVNQDDYQITWDRVR